MRSEPGPKTRPTDAILLAGTVDGLQEHTQLHANALTGCLAGLTTATTTGKRLGLERQLVAWLNHIITSATTSGLQQSERGRKTPGERKKRKRTRL